MCISMYFLSTRQLHGTNTNYPHVCVLLYHIILSLNQEAHVETTPIPPALTLATQQHKVTKPSAGNRSIASSSRKKRCGQCVGCRTPDCGKRFCANKKRWRYEKIEERIHSSAVHRRATYINHILTIILLYNKGYCYESFRSTCSKQMAR